MNTWLTRLDMIKLEFDDMRVQETDRKRENKIVSDNETEGKRDMLGWIREPIVTLQITDWNESNQHKSDDILYE